MKLKTFIISLTLATLASMAASTDSRWTYGDSGLRATIVVDRHNPKTGEVVTITFAVNNNGTNSISIPKPDEGTLILHIGENTILGAEPGRPDEWMTLDPKKAHFYNVTHSWAVPGTYRVYFEYYSRFESKPFEMMKTPSATITVE